MKPVAPMPTASAPATHATDAAARSVPVAGAPLDSSILLGAKGEVEIAHEGETYRLRRTRQGKLILTK